MQLGVFELAKFMVLGLQNERKRVVGGLKRSRSKHTLLTCKASNNRAVKVADSFLEPHELQAAYGVAQCVTWTCRIKY
jgi:hypothetical protein